MLCRGACDGGLQPRAALLFEKFQNRNLAGLRGPSARPLVQRAGRIPGPQPPQHLEVSPFRCDCRGLLCQGTALRHEPVENVHMPSRRCHVCEPLLWPRVLPLPEPAQHAELPGLRSVGGGPIVHLAPILGRPPQEIKVPSPRSPGSDMLVKLTPLPPRPYQQLQVARLRRQPADVVGVPGAPLLAEPAKAIQVAASCGLRAGKLVPLATLGPRPLDEF